MRLRNLSLGATLPNKFPRQNQERNQAHVKAKFLAKKPEHILFYGFSDSNKTRWNPSSHEHQSFWMAPFLENRNGQSINQNNSATTTLKEDSSANGLQPNQVPFCLFSSTIEHSFTERGRKGAVLHSELANNCTRPMGLRNRSELQNRTAKRPWQSRIPFTPGNVSNLSDRLLVEEIRILLRKGLSWRVSRVSRMGGPTSLRF